MNINTIDRATVDAGRVRVGAAYKLLPGVPASVRDAGRVKLGAAYKLLPRGVQAAAARLSLSLNARMARAVRAVCPT